MEELDRVFSELQAAAAAREWQAMEKLATEHDRLLRAMLINPEPETIAYLETIRDQHARLLDLVLAARKEMRDQIKVLAKGRKAVAAYR